MTTSGSLCTGILGLDRATADHFGAELAWYSEVEPAPLAVIEREHPGVPNLGDLTVIDWAAVEPVDVLTAGYPCQPFSHAGNRKGASDVRHLWPFIAEAVRVLRPRRVVLENVAGHLSLGFGDVLRDLAEAGFDAEWCVLRASDVGAPHQRARLFIVARDADRAREDALATAGGSRHPAGESSGAVADPSGERHGGGQDGGAVGRVDGGDAGEARERERSRPVVGYRGGTVAAYADVRRREQRDEGVGRVPVAHAVGAAPADAQRLGPQGSDDPRGGEGLGAPGSEPAGAHPAVAWGDYEPAIRRWEHTLGRPAPRPTDDTGRLSPTFVEWMQGYPEGWTAELGRTAALKALGNAVVPQQAAAALEELAA